MKLTKVEIENYKSIKREVINLKAVEDGFCYGFLGINGSGKSNLLKAINLKDDKGPFNYNNDVNSESKIEKVPISVVYTYTLNGNDADLFRQKLEKEGLEKSVTGKIKIKEVKIQTTISSSSVKKDDVIFSVENDLVRGYFYNGSQVVKQEPAKKEGESQEAKELDIKQYLTAKFSQYILDQAHKIIFWKSEDRYLIMNSINLNTFASDPSNISIPLRNCFGLCGKKENQIQSLVTEIISDNIKARETEEELGKEVTKHINTMWPGHKIEVSFRINGANIVFLVRDIGGKYNTVNDRSDGFRQFVSFLLTVSAEKTVGTLENKILLLDEPETHLHPTAQENIRDNLIEIAKDHNNVVFFASHSNYMIDKANLDRYFQVTKDGKRVKETKIKKFESKNTSYSEINYIVFDIPTNDYHNELYGYLEDVLPDKLDLIPKNESWNNEKTNKKEKVSLAKYIRNSIHHPENTSNKKVDPDMLIKSIKILREIKCETK